MHMWVSTPPLQCRKVPYMFMSPTGASAERGGQLITVPIKAAKFLCRKVFRTRTLMAHHRAPVSRRWPGGKIWYFHRVKIPVTSWLCRTERPLRSTGISGIGFLILAHRTLGNQCWLHASRAGVGRRNTKLFISEIPNL